VGDGRVAGRGQRAFEFAAAGLRGGVAGLGCALGPEPAAQWRPQLAGLFDERPSGAALDLAVGQLAFEFGIADAAIAGDLVDPKVLVPVLEVVSCTQRPNIKRPMAAAGRWGSSVRIATSTVRPFGWVACTMS